MKRVSVKQKTNSLNRKTCCKEANLLFEESRGIYRT